MGSVIVLEDFEDPTIGTLVRGELIDVDKLEIPAGVKTAPYGPDEASLLAALEILREVKPARTRPPITEQGGTYQPVAVNLGSVIGVVFDLAVFQRLADAVTVQVRASLLGGLVAGSFEMTVPTMGPFVVEGDATGIVVTSLGVLGRVVAVPNEPRVRIETIAAPGNVLQSWHVSFAYRAPLLVGSNP